MFDATSFLRQDEILRSQWISGQVGFYPSKDAERPGKNKEEISSEDTEASGLEQFGSLVTCERHGIPVEGDTAHNVACSWIQRIVFPQRQKTSWPQGTPDVMGACRPPDDRNVMKHPAAIDEVHFLRWEIITNFAKHRLGTAVLLCRAFNEFLRR